MRKNPLLTAQDCEDALRLQPCHQKCTYRRFCALHEMRFHSAALQARPRRPLCAACCDRGSLSCS